MREHTDGDFPFANDFNAIAEALADNGSVVLGCTVGTGGTNDMSVAVSSGEVRVNGAKTVVDAQSVTVNAADPDHDRYDLIVVDDTGSATTVTGTADTTPKAPQIPADTVLLAIVRVKAGIGGLGSADLLDARAILSPSLTEKPDLRFAILPDELEPSTRAEFYQDFERFARSYSTMNTIAYYPTVMDEVSTSETAMDAVSASSLAMDAVSTSIMPRTAILHSSHVRGSVWTETIGAEKLWEAGEPTPPASNLGGEDIDVEMIQDRSESAHQLRVEHYNSNSGGPYTYDLAIDWGEASTLRIYTAADSMMPKRYLTVQIGGSEVFSTTSDHGWTERLIDVSGYSGEQDLQMGIQIDSTSRNTRTTEFAEIQLE